MNEKLLSSHHRWRIIDFHDTRSVNMFYRLRPEMLSGDNLYLVTIMDLRLSLVPGGRLNIKMSSYQYRDYHVKDKTVSPTVLSLTWKSPYVDKTVFILRRGPGIWNMFMV